MTRRIIRFSAIPLLAMLLFGLQEAQAQYRYGEYRGFEEQGFFVFLDAGIYNPRNSDSVAATATSGDATLGPASVSQIVPDWDGEFAGRLGVGYEWSTGNKLVFSVWSFSADQDVRGTGPGNGSLHFTVGPPIPVEVETINDECLTSTGDLCTVTTTELVRIDSGSPGFVDMTTEIEAATADLAWARSQELSEKFDMEWSVGLRYAHFEETMEGLYDEADYFDPGSGVIRAAKSNEADMIGLRAAARGSYSLSEKFSVRAGLAVSFLDGEIESRSSLTPEGTIDGVGVAPSTASFDDDGRSGTTRDFDLAVVWHAEGDRFEISLGWEQSNWDDLADDLVRNFPSTSAPLRDRDSITFSGYKLGFLYRF